MTWTTRPRSEVAGHAAIRTGSGPDVLLLHGVGLRAEAWGAQIDGLSGAAQVTAPDLPGHGDSTVAVDNTITTYVSAADDVLQALSGPAVIVGHSMGAMLTVALAHLRPERALGVVVLNGVFERPKSAANAVARRAAELDGMTASDPTATLLRWFGNTHCPAREACARWLTDTDPSSYKNAYKAFASSAVPTREQLAALRCPALFMTGGAEANSTPDMSREMAQLTPEGRAQIVPDAAHMMPMTHPEPVTAAILQMLNEVRP